MNKEHTISPKLVGFTGNRHGFNTLQKNLFEYYVRKYRQFEFHHGDCVGCDSEAHNVVTKLASSTTIAHPPENPKQRAYCSADIILPEKPYLVRNHDIVDATDILIAVPGQIDEVKRSGTWATIRYARNQNKKILIIRPNGAVTTELPK